MQTGEYQPEVSRALVDSLPVGGVCVDVGANVGYMTMLAARKVGPAGRVVAIEPSPASFERLQEHLSRNSISSVTAIRAGCLDTPSRLPLFIASDLNPGKTSLSPANAHSGSKVLVRVDTLDALLDGVHLSRLDVIKIDVEGAELGVLGGATETLRRFRPTVICELSDVLLREFGTQPEDVLSFLAAMGYRSSWISDSDILACPI